MSRIKQLLKEILVELNLESKGIQSTANSFRIEEWGFSFNGLKYETTHYVDSFFIEDKNLVIYFSSERPQQSSNKLTLTPDDFEEMSEFFTKLFEKDE